MRSRLAALALVALALAMPAAAAADAPSFTISGRGYGHGVGMSQWGAFGFARAGGSYRQILAHYYPGAQPATTRDETVRVLLAERQPTITVGSHANFTATDASGRARSIPAGSYRINPTLTIELPSGALTLAGPVRLAQGRQPLELAGRAYRGTLVLRVDAATLSASNELPLEQYLLGVVPQEIPVDWPEQALKAQAVAARSYALATRRASGWFDFYADTRSQAYGGIAAEDRRATAAVEATVGEILTHERRPAQTFFFSSSGGRTAAPADVWAGASTLPYLVAVDDPYDTASPYHRWEPLTYSAAELTRRLGRLAPPGLRDIRVTRNGSGRAQTVTAVGSAQTTSIPAAQFAAALGLRSTWFAVTARS